MVCRFWKELKTQNSGERTPEQLKSGAAKTPFRAPTSSCFPGSFH